MVLLAKGLNLQIELEAHEHGLSDPLPNAIYEFVYLLQSVRAGISKKIVVGGGLGKWKAPATSRDRWGFHKFEEGTLENSGGA